MSVEFRVTSNFPQGSLHLFGSLKTSVKTQFSKTQNCFMKRPYTIVLYTENKIGLVNRVTNIFVRRHINIESITASESEMEGVHRFTIQVEETEELVIKITKQIEKQVDVLKAFWYANEDIYMQEIALYKVSLGTGQNIEQLVREKNARILAMDRTFVVIEKAGFKRETQELYDLLQPYGLIEFARSGSVVLSRGQKVE